VSKANGEGTIQS